MTSTQSGRESHCIANRIGLLLNLSDDVGDLLRAVAPRQRPTDSELGPCVPVLCRLLVDLRNEHGGQSDPALPLPALREVGGEHPHEFRLQRFEILRVEIQRGA